MKESIDSGAVSESEMNESVSPAMYVTQSRYFSPAFNAAIFDGPIRIYFAQYQESQALKLYFNLQERFSDVRKQARGIFKERGRNIFVMIYPTEETFGMSFGSNSLQKTDSAGAVRATVLQGKLGNDVVIGVRGPLEDETVEDICMVVDSVVHS